ncbi:hypothetical protein [Nitrosovibrio tenuis]|uniref:Uncharacterized protein n=1 Tax=Nitrosovibrio tenuis TaxID=1233 RepID=A0A1H7MS31_9PROT|nr:hypothetical protein [Nitrosovibrio tenuis]SEL13859.1 hypothetical protein SAMN05216387_105185 [Nitrosovibrio tenuis]
MNPKPRRIAVHVSQSSPQASHTLIPVSQWKSAAIGVTAYVFEESEATLRQCGLIPDWINYPHRPGGGIAVPAHHHFPNYLKLLRLGSGRMRLVIDVRAVLRKDAHFQRFLGGLTNDTNLSLVKGESA